MTTELPVMPAISEREIVDYLRRHPDFFQRHEHLLLDLALPHPGVEGAVSLVERQISILREQEQALKRKLQTIVQVARTNEQLLQRMQRLILGVMGAGDLDEALKWMAHSLKEDFHADAIAIRLTAEAAQMRPEYMAPGAAEAKAVERVLVRSRPVCGYLSPEQVELLFPERAAEIASGALIPLAETDSDRGIGLIGVGSLDPRRFHPEMGTVFLSHLGAILAKVIRSYL